MSKQMSFGKWKWAAAVSLLLAAGAVHAQVLITNVETVNVTPSGFSVLALVSGAVLSPASTTLSVFADSGGVTNLAGQVGVEFYPLNTGSPAAANEYQTLLSKSSLSASAMSQGFVYARLSGGAPGATYYYQLTVTNGGGQSATWPASGPLPAVTTPPGNSFVLVSGQLLLNVDATYAPGSIVTLSYSNSLSALAAVVGDGTGSNQVFFNLNDLFAAAGLTNQSPAGTQLFTATVYGSGPQTVTEDYEVTFPTSFSVGGFSIGTLGELVTTISLGTGAMLTGGTGTVPISVSSPTAVTTLSFILQFPTNLFTRISVQPESPAVGSVLLTPLTSNSFALNLTAAFGNSLQVTQQVAQLNLTAAPGLPSAFIPITIPSAAATNADSTVVQNFAFQPGQAVIIGQQSLLQMQSASEGVNLILYGVPGEAYQIQSSTNPRTGWGNYHLVPMTSVSQTFSNIYPAGPYLFFRAYSFNAHPPLLQSVDGPGRSLLIYGVPGTDYTLQTTTNLAGGNWSTVANSLFTNAFSYLTNLGNAAPAFYRLQQP